MTDTLSEGSEIWYPGCVTSEARNRWPNLLQPRSRKEIEARYPLYAEIPTGWAENLEFRKSLIERARTDTGLQRELRQMCAADLMFFVNVFGWTVNPKSESNAIIPVITPVFQTALFIELENAIGKRDLLVEKSREMYATWSILITFAHRFLFRDYVTFLCISRNEDMVDKRGDPKALFSKLDFFFAHLPTWLKPPIVRSSMHYQNLTTDSTLDGDSTTGSAARGDRRTALMLDEAADYDAGMDIMASTQRASDSRIFNSTHQGTGTAFYNMSRNPGVRSVFVHWSLSPARAIGMYGTDAGGRLKIVDKDFDFPPNYPFVVDGRMRSPLQDLEFLRAPHPRLYDQEEDGDCMGSDELVFDPVVLARAMDEDVQAPALTGELTGVEGDGPPGVEPAKSGRLKVWVEMDSEKRPPGDNCYVIGADISAGLGASNSVISVVDATNSVKAAEWSSNAVPPDELGRVCSAMARLFTSRHGSPRVIWESNSALGRNFGRELMLRHSNVFWRVKEDEFLPRETDVPGWHSSKSGKWDWMLELAKALRNRDYTERSEYCILEARMYILGKDGGVYHSRTRRAESALMSEKSHGDHCIATMLAWRMAKSLRDGDVDNREHEMTMDEWMDAMNVEARVKETVY